MDFSSRNQHYDNHIELFTQVSDVAYVPLVFGILLMVLCYYIFNDFNFTKPRRWCSGLERSRQTYVVKTASVSSTVKRSALSVSAMGPRR